MDYSWHFCIIFSEVFLMDEVECLSETLNTTFVTIQNDLKGQQVEIQSLITEYDEQQAEIVQLTTQDELQQIKINQISSDSEGQRVEIQRLTTENAEQKYEIKQLKIQNEQQQIILYEQGTQLAEQKYNIEQLTSQNEQQQILLDEQKNKTNQIASQVSRLLDLETKRPGSLWFDAFRYRHSSLVVLFNSVVFHLTRIF